MQCSVYITGVSLFIFARQLLIRWFALSLYWTLKCLNLYFDKERSPKSVVQRAKLLNIYFRANDNVKEKHLYHVRAGT